MSDLTLYTRLVLFSGLILCVSTIVNFILGRLKPDAAIFAKVSIIIRSWWIIIGVCLAFGYFGRNGVILLFLLICLAVIREYFNISKLKETKPVITALLCGLAFAQAFAIYANSFWLFTFLPMLFVLIGFPTLIFSTDDLNDLPYPVASYLGVLMLVHSLFYLPAFVSLAATKLGGIDSALVCFFVIFGLTQLNDVFQFICGKSFGRRKVVPNISPNKTEAGFIGGIILTTILGTYLFTAIFGIPTNVATGLSFLVACFGILGDLTFSAIKRFFDVKDFSTILPGHGGIIDRMDSLVFTGPMTYLVFFLFV